MLKGIKVALYASLFVAIASCKRSVDAAAYVKYVTDKRNGITKITEIDGFEYRMQYRTHDQIILSENKGDKNSNNIEKRKESLKGTVWFNISLKRTDNAISILRYGISNIDQYNARLNYYLNYASSDIKLLYGEDTLHPTGYVFENNYNLAPQETIVVSFTLPPGNNYPQKNMRLSMVDGVFNNGIINASFPIETINKIPTLKY